MDGRSFAQLVGEHGFGEALERMHPDVRARGRTVLEAFNVSGVTLVDPDLREFDFLGCKWNDVRLIRPLLDDASFKDGTFENVRIEEGRFLRVRADHITWKDCRLSACTFDKSEFVMASAWQNLYADGISWNGGKFTDGSWKDCNLSGARFTNLDARSLIIRDCRFARTEFTKVDLRAAKFEPEAFETAILAEVATTLSRYKDKPDPRFCYFASAKGDSLIPPDEQAPS